MNINRKQSGFPSMQTTRNEIINSYNVVVCINTSNRALVIYPTKKHSKIQNYFRYNIYVPCLFREFTSKSIKNYASLPPRVA